MTTLRSVLLGRHPDRAHTLPPAGMAGCLKTFIYCQRAYERAGSSPLVRCLRFGLVEKQDLRTYAQSWPKAPRVGGY